MDFSRIVIFLSINEIVFSLSHKKHYASFKLVTDFDEDGDLSGSVCLGVLKYLHSQSHDSSVEKSPNSASKICKLFNPTRELDCTISVG